MANVAFAPELASEPQIQKKDGLRIADVIEIVNSVWEHWKGTTTAQKVAIEQLSTIYQFKTSSVSKFLCDNPFLIELLFEVHQKIRYYFDLHINLALEVFTDPEGGESQELFALVLTSLPPEEALDCLDRFDRDWWLEASERGKYCLNVDVEYV